MARHPPARRAEPREPARRLSCKTCGHEDCVFLPIVGTTEREWLKCNHCGHARTVAARRELDPEARASASRITDILQQLVLTQPDLIIPLEAAVREFLAKHPAVGPRVCAFEQTAGPERVKTLTAEEGTDAERRQSGRRRTRG